MEIVPFTKTQQAVIAILATGGEIRQWGGDLHPQYRLSALKAVNPKTFQALEKAGMLHRGPKPARYGLPTVWTLSETGKTWAVENL